MKCCVNQNQSNRSSQSQRTQITQWTNQNLRKTHEDSAKRGKMCTRESRLVLVLSQKARAFKPLALQSKVKPNKM